MNVFERMVRIVRVSVPVTPSETSLTCACTEVFRSPVLLGAVLCERGR